MVFFINFLSWENQLWLQGPTLFLSVIFLTLGVSHEHSLLSFSRGFSFPSRLLFHHTVLSIFYIDARCSSWREVCLIACDIPAYNNQNVLLKWNCWALVCNWTRRVGEAGRWDWKKRIALWFTQVIAFFLNLKLIFSWDVVPFVVCGSLLHDEGEFVLVFRQIPLACCTWTIWTFCLVWSFCVPNRCRIFFEVSRYKHPRNTRALPVFRSQKCSVTLFLKNFLCSPLYVGTLYFPLQS